MRHDRLTGVVVDADGEIATVPPERPTAGRPASSEHRIDTTDVDTVVDAATKIVDELRSLHPDLRQPIGLGVQVSGQIDDRTGTVVRSHRMGWQQPVPLASLLEDATGLHTRVDHDVRTLVLAEQAFGLGRRRRSFAVVTVGAGIGAGLVLDGSVWRGESCAAAELGHVLLDSDGRRCPCGNRGCLETVAGSAGVLRAINADRTGAVDDIEAAAGLARAGDEPARRAFRRAGEALGFGLSWLVTLADPGLVVVRADPAIRGADGWEEVTRAAFGRHGFSASARACELVFLDLGHSLGARSAGAMVLSVQGEVRSGAPDQEAP